MTLFSDQLHWFARLKRKQRFCVLYFCMSFGILLSIFFINPLLELLVVLNRDLRAAAEEACPFE